MLNPEKENLFFLEGETEMHISSHPFSVRALREIVRFQVYRDDAPTEIKMVYEKKIVILSTSTILKARNLFGKDRRRFLDVVASTMYDAEEIIILKQRGAGIRATNRSSDPRYNTVFQKFIENNFISPN